MAIGNRIIAAASVGALAVIVGVIVVTGDDSSPSAVAVEQNAQPGAATTDVTVPRPASTSEEPARSGPTSTAPAPALTTASPTTVPATTPTTTPTTSTTVASPGVDLPDRGPHPPLRDIDGWLQSDVTSLEELRGQVVAVQFWTFGCSNCKATLPHLQDLYAEYHDQGFEIVGVHSPEFEYEEDVDSIVAAAADLGVTWPIALDPTRHSFHDWQDGPRGFWPRIYLLDRDGNVRYDHRGEGRYEEIEAAVGALLAEPAS